MSLGVSAAAAWWSSRGAEVFRGETPILEGRASCVSPRGGPRDAAIAALGAISCRSLKYLWISPEILPAGVPLVTALVLYFLVDLIPLLMCRFAGYEGSGWELSKKAASLSHVQATPPF